MWCACLGHVHKAMYCACIGLLPVATLEVSIGLIDMLKLCMKMSCNGLCGMSN